MVFLEFKLVYNDAGVQCINHYARGSQTGEIELFDWID